MRICFDREIERGDVPGPRGAGDSERREYEDIPEFVSRT